jgi:hypothetical protein
MANQIGDVLNSTSNPAQDPVVQTENQTILGVHAAMEAFSDEADLAGTFHGLTNLGETAGLGRVGGDNLITDTAQTPGDVANGASPVADTANIVTDAGDTVGAAGGFVQGIGSDLSNPDVAQDVTNGLTGATLGTGTNGGSEPLVSAGAGASGGSPILDTGVLTTPDSGTPISLAAGNGQNIANVDALNGSSGDHLITGDAGAAGGSPIADAGVLTTPDSQSPVGAEVGNGPNIANASLLSNSDALQTVSPALQGVNGTSDTGDHLITGDAGAAGGSPIADAGVLTTPDSQSPVGAEVGNGQNVADASALSHSDVLSFPNMGGAGTDALTGVVPSAIDVGNVLSDNSAPASSDQSLVDAHTDGAPLVQVHDNPTSTLGVNDHAIV